MDGASRGGESNEQSRGDFFRHITVQEDRKIRDRHGSQYVSDMAALILPQPSTFKISWNAHPSSIGSNSSHSSQNVDPV